MSKATKNGAGMPETTFVEIAQHPSLGVELSSGRAWVGVDQQVGHGSADALFALTDEQYAAALVDAWPLRPFEGECWRGEHPDLLLFHPAGGAWRPAGWSAARTRVIPPRVAGEIWRHVDALGDAGERAAISQALAAGTARISADSLSFSLAEYPRPAALIAGLTHGSSREQVRAVLGAAAEDGTYSLEGDVLRLDYVDEGLAEIVLERARLRETPSGRIGAILAALGEPEQGAAYRTAAAPLGGRARRWAVSSGFTRRLIAFDGGGEIQVEGGRVLSVSIPWREDLDLGAPAATSGGRDLYRFAEGDLVDEHGRVTAVLHGVSVSRGINRWRSGEFTLFLDALGLAESHPLVEHVKALAGVRLDVRRGVVAAVEIGRQGHQTERFAAFVDGMPAEPLRTEIPLARPAPLGDRDDVYYFEQGFIRTHSSDGARIDWIVVAQGEPNQFEGTAPPHQLSDLSQLH